MWTQDNRRRMTEGDVTAAFGGTRPPDLSEREVYERTRTWPADQVRQRRDPNLDVNLVPPTVRRPQREGR